ncbi:MAG TPA: tetratricopeptide repeat protein [Tepidisphaeraceae bacterium]|jgi:tetratricopeptide (TPR) repeat protein|nr:tetratricopeptide repeat protein [Tepidisphaeraceae bacterium]
MAQLLIKYRTEGKALAPRPIKASLPGWGGSAAMKKENGSQPQPWHCPLFMEGCTHGVELLYQYEAECHVINENGKVRIEWDRAKEPGGMTGPSDFTIAIPPVNYLFATSIDLQPPPGYVLRTEPHPRFFADTTGTVPAAVYGHVHGEWWPKKLFVVFKMPDPGQRHIFRKGDPYVHVLCIPEDEHEIQCMSSEEADARRQLEKNISLSKSLIAKNLWNSASGIEFNDHYKVLSRAFNRDGIAGVNALVADAMTRLEASVPPGKTAEEYLEIAKQLQSQKRRVEAKEALHRTLQLNPQSAEAYNQLSHLEWELGLREVAVRAMRHAAALEPKNPFYLRNLSEVLRRVGKLDEAQSACAAALALEPENPETITALAFTVARRGQLAEGLDLCRKAIAIAPNSPHPRFVTGLILAWAKRSDEARAHYEAALALDPNFAPAQNAMKELPASSAGSEPSGAGT